MLEVENMEEFVDASQDAPTMSMFFARETCMEARERHFFASGRLVGESEGKKLLAETLGIVLDLIRDATNHSSCQNCAVERKMESVYGYIAGVIKLVEQGKGEDK